jgi:hypothetical protein
MQHADAQGMAHAVPVDAAGVEETPGISGRNDQAE